jgi:NitT/TauT family transport system ATP-binding protein
MNEVTHPGASDAVGTNDEGCSGLQLELEHVTAQFGTAGDPALDDVSFTVAPGSFTSFVGPSGCGKSTLLRICAGLLLPSRGSVRLWAGSGEAIQETGSQFARSFVFQQPTLLPWRNVIANVTLPLDLRGTPKSTSRDEAARACQLVGLHEQDLSKLPRMLSGGMQMRVSLARALVTHPLMMLMDEPFAAIDDLLRQQLNQDVLTIWQRQRWTGIFVTHQLHEAVFMSQRVVILSAGPGRILGRVDVPFDYPRTNDLRTSVEFARCVQDVNACLRQGVAR